MDYGTDGSGAGGRNANESMRPSVHSLIPRYRRLHKRQRKLNYGGDICISECNL
jgi:hypothetical protein